LLVDQQRDVIDSFCSYLNSCHSLSVRSNFDEILKMAKLTV
jgi:hypothetical protein